MDMLLNEAVRPSRVRSFVGGWDCMKSKEPGKRGFRLWEWND